jgi:putative flippase GtrA
MERFLSFAGIGIVATAIQYIVLTAGVHFAGADPVWASTGGFIVSATINYLLNRRYTFHSRKPHIEASAKFFTVALVGLLLNGALLAAGTELIGLHYLLAQILTTGLVLIWNYTANTVWTFAEGR